ncbi:MAG: AAA family ATPase [Leptolyngbyaceae bacterium]|nr:AAA family ATPase [Leptolyngbyaceae bacterium]
MAPPFLKRYLIAFDRHKWVGLTGFLIVLGVSAIAALQPKPPASYRARGVMVYVAPPLTFSATVATLQEQGQALTEARLLSDEVLEFVSQQLEQQDINISPFTLRRNTRATVETEPILQVTLTYDDENSDHAETIAAFLMDAMAEQSRIFNTVQLNRITENLNALLPQVEQDLARAEQRLEAYIREEGPVLQAARDGGLVGAITGSESQQRAIQLTIEGLNAQINSLQNRLGMSPDEAYASSALSADPIISSLRQQLYQNETQIAILGQRLQPEHPQMEQLLIQQRAFEDLLQQRVQEVIGGSELASPLQSTERIRQSSSLDPARQQLANQLVALQAERETQEQLLNSQIRLEQELRDEYETIPNKQLQQAQLTQEASLKRAFYNQIQARLEDVTLAEKETVGSLVVAQPPQAEVEEEGGQGPVVILLIGGFLGVVVGGGLIVLLDSLDSTYRTAEDLQAAISGQEIPVLGVLPTMPTLEGDRRIPVMADINSPYLDAFERFRSNVRRMGGSKPPVMVLITSTIAKEGKTVSAYNLAIASAYAGRRTLLIEADLRSPSQSHALGVAMDEDALIEPINYYGNSNESIRLVPHIENLYILPSLGVQRQAAAILESTEMKRILEDARIRFDFVVLDAPSLSLCNDALLLEPFTDGIILATRPGYTEEGLLNEAAEQFLESDDVQLLGAVIDDADIQVTPIGRDHSDEESSILDAMNLDIPEAPEPKSEEMSGLEQISAGLRKKD